MACLSSGCGDRRRDPGVAAVSALSAAIHPYADPSKVEQLLTRESRLWLRDALAQGQNGENASKEQPVSSALKVVPGWRFEVSRGRALGRVREQREGFRLVEQRLGDRLWRFPVYLEDEGWRVALHQSGPVEPLRVRRPARSPAEAGGGEQ
ncbi:MAG: hypothetical protein VYD19_04565 [Myxococcota bacterium]|nr:hypothetical protein [Myxococcota bacterium]